MQAKLASSRWKLLGTFLLSYAGAVLVAMVIFAVTTLRSGHFDWEVTGAVAWAFPAGLFVLVRSDLDWGILVGYVLYVLLAAVGVAFKLRAVLVVFIMLLVLNIGGCCWALYNFESSGWHCKAAHAIPQCPPSGVA